MIKPIIIFCLILLISVEIYGKRVIVKRKTTKKTRTPVEAWTGKWFPGPPHPKDDWKGKWFPYPPYTNGQTLNGYDKKRLTASEICDDGKVLYYNVYISCFDNINFFIIHIFAAIHWNRL